MSEPKVTYIVGGVEVDPDGQPVKGAQKPEDTDTEAPEDTEAKPARRAPAKG